MRRPSNITIRLTNTIVWQQPIQIRSYWHGMKPPVTLFAKVGLTTNQSVTKLKQMDSAVQQTKPGPVRLESMLP